MIMKKVLISLALVSIISLAGLKSFAQLSDEQYSYVTMDLQGILKLTMTTDPQVDFVFNTIQKYQQGIRKFNIVKLEVDATVSWDLFAYASTNNWIQTEAYSHNGQATLPAEILQIQAVSGTGGVANGTAATHTFNAEHPICGLTNSAVVANVPTVNTQFVAGMFGTAANQSVAPGTAKENPATHQFRLHYRLKPEVPAAFSAALAGAVNGTPSIAAPGYAQAGYYYLEVVYSLVEDL
jgi:hypothetical protein